MTCAPRATSALTISIVAFKQSIESKTRFNSRVDRRGAPDNEIIVSFWLHKRFHECVKRFAILGIRKVRRAVVEEQMRFVGERMPQLRQIMSSELAVLNLKLAHIKRRTLARTAGSRKEQER
jgi:hypothetical protein